MLPGYIPLLQVEIVYQLGCTLAEGLTEPAPARVAGARAAPPAAVIGAPRVAMGRTPPPLRAACSLQIYFKDNISYPMI